MTKSRAKKEEKHCALRKTFTKKRTKYCALRKTFAVLYGRLLFFLLCFTEDFFQNTVLYGRLLLCFTEDFFLKNSFKSTS